MSKTYVEIIKTNLDTLSKYPELSNLIKNIEALNIIIFKFAKMPRNVRTQAVEFYPFVSTETPQSLEKQVSVLLKNYFKGLGKDLKFGSLNELFKTHMKTHELIPVPTTETYELTLKFINDLKQLTTKVTRSNEDMIKPSLEHIMNSSNRKLSKCQFTKKEGYLACYVPIKIRSDHTKISKFESGSLSDHITVGYQEEEIQKYIKYLGQIVTVELSKVPIEWVDDESNKKYAYYPVHLTFHDNETMFSHISVHNKNNENNSWGTQYGKNHIHQSTIDHNGLFGNDSDCIVFRTILCFYSRFHDDSKALISCDFDRTLMHSPEHAEGDMRFLNDPKQIKEELITEFGKFILNLGIPFTVTTSRRCNEDENLRAKMTEAIKLLFPKCIDVSYGSSIVARNEESRSEEKARCKSRRVKLIHYDDEIIVLNHVTGCLVTNTPTEFSLQTFLTFKSQNEVSNDHLKVMLIGPPGSGKTTLISDLINHFETEKRRIYYAATDSCEVNHDFVPDLSIDPQPSCLLFDSTGDGRDIGREWSVISLCPKRNAIDLLGTIDMIFNRKNHATLNGSNLTYIPSSSADTSLIQHNRYNKNQMDIVTLVNTLFSHYKCRVEDLRSFFNLIGYDCKLTQFETKISNSDQITSMLTIGYREGFQQWNALWGRQARNIIVIQDTNKTFVVLKAGLMAGSEIKPVDIGDSYRKKVSNIQHAIKDHLLTGKQLPEGTVLTSKVDGCLIQITIVREHVDYLFNVLSKSNHSDPFNSMFMEKTYVPNKSFAIISTNGTLFVPEIMKTTIVTSIAHSCGVKFKSDELLLDVWSKCVEIVNTQLNIYTSLTGHDLTETLQFEAVVANRTPGVFADYAIPNKHVELTIDYDIPMFVFLGTRMGTSKYVPHFDIENYVEMIGWQQPLFWKCNDSFAIAHMLDDLETVSTGQMTHSKYIKTWKPSNMSSDPKNITLDLEGFVMLMPFGDTYIYDKLKTIIYYVVHKPREHMMDYIQNVIDTDGSGNFLKYFPKIRTVMELKSALKSITFSLDEIYNLVSKYTMSNDPKDYVKDNKTDKEDMTEKMNKMKQAFDKKINHPSRDRDSIVKFITTNPNVFKGLISPSEAIAHLAYSKLGKLDDVLNKQKALENQIYRNDYERQNTLAEFSNQYYHVISSLINDIVTNRNLEKSMPLFVRKITHNIISL